MKVLRASLLAAALAAIAAVLAGGGAARSSENGDLSFLGNKRSVSAHLAGAKGKHPHGIPSRFECTAPGGGANTKLDCDDPLPNNEPDIEVDPANPNHMVASSNDYGSCCDQYYTSFDAGQSWSTGNMSTERPTALGPIGSDPVTVFDTKHGTTVHASLNFFFNEDFTQVCNGDLTVSLSYNGGLDWVAPVVVDQGKGCDLDKLQIFNDKEWIVVDNNPSSKFYGRTYLTWSKFLAHFGAYASSAIWESHSDDGGRTWSRPHPISGRNPLLCTFQTTGHKALCDEDQFSVPTVGADGTVYVAFENEQNEALWEPGELFEDQYLLVTSTDGGKTWSSPTFVVGLEDGTADYPINVDGRQTLTGYQARVNSAGNIVAGLARGVLNLVFSDNRNGTHDSTTPVTNTDVFVMRSTDGGATWSAPSLVDSGAGDQWFPWVEVNPTNGTLGIVYHDRGASNGTFYNTALAEGTPGSLVKTTVSTAPSDPVHSEFFQSGDPACPECAVFFGDYINVSYGSDGHANLTWTDMREPTPDGFAQFIDYARK
jgi:photosystem II stability/assembly factor-like uncharacterized protein